MFHKLLLATTPLGRGGSMQYFCKGPGSAEPWLSTKKGGGGVRNTRTETRFAEVAL